MDPSIARLLNDRLYDKRKQGALDLEKLIRDAANAGDNAKIAKAIHALCNDFAYAVNQPHARNGGLIGLAAAAIALGAEDVAPYLSAIVPPVLACFTDPDARVRYYACESMYNIAKVAKGEVLVYFNDVFDALCKLAADSELSVKNGAELLDRLIKDIVSESAASYVSVTRGGGGKGLESEQNKDNDEEAVASIASSQQLPTAFSLPKFIPLLQERIHVLNPFTRTFLVSWVTLLDTIPDLELVAFLPSFLGGLFKFLADTNKDVHVATQGCLSRFLKEIQKIAAIKKDLAEHRRSKSDDRGRLSDTGDGLSVQTGRSGQDGQEEKEGSVVVESESEGGGDGDWIPGQDVQVDFPAILEILVSSLDSHANEEIQITALVWMDSLFDICPDDILVLVPRLLARVLPAMASGSEKVRSMANRVNNSLMDFIASLPSESNPEEVRPAPLNRVSTAKLNDPEGLKSRQSSIMNLKPSAAPSPAPSPHPLPADQNDGEGRRDEPYQSTATPPQSAPLPSSPQPSPDLDYVAAVDYLTNHFLNTHETTRVAAMSWLIMLHRKAPRKVLSTNEGTFPALLKTLSDDSETVVTRDLQLLSQISKNSDDTYFSSFMVNLLQLFSTDRKLLETRGNLIIRQLCNNLNAERIYRTLADCLEREEDVEFASIMVQNLNNNLITAPELAELRKRLRNLDSKDGQSFFVALFRTWSHNAVSTFSLCLLAQAYEQAYSLLQIFADLEMTVNMLIQIDKLVQLLESPVFTYLRLQLLEPERYPHLYKCLYGLLMLLPQSAAFAALRNRLGSVSAIGYLHIPSRAPPPTPTVAFDRPNRLKAREDNPVKWGELLERFRQTQDRAARKKHSGTPGSAGTKPHAAVEVPEITRTPVDKPGSRPASVEPGPGPLKPPGPGHKARSSLSNFSRLTGRVGSSKNKKAEKPEKP